MGVILLGAVHEGVLAAGQSVRHDIGVVIDVFIVGLFVLVNGDGDYSQL